jgi:hypothetical protein
MGSEKINLPSGLCSNSPPGCKGLFVCCLANKMCYKAMEFARKNVSLLQK